MNVRFFYLAGEKKGLNAVVGGKKVKPVVRGHAEGNAPTGTK